MNRNATAAPVEIHRDDEEGQMSNWQNGTLQGCGPATAVTIQTHVDGVDGTPDAVAAELNRLLTAASAATGGQVTFTVVVGPTIDALTAP
ncbi:hypothetical protein [Euzebya pacifica]|nr:hypothetical protein [Euzebya pacifica]